MSDIKEFETADLSTRGIYINVEDNDISRLVALIIGPEGTPYQFGFYFFLIDFPMNYPFSPPTVTFLTQDPRFKVRFHPNLYVRGKVCLSMLNTWDGPGWSPVQSLTSILLTIQSIMDNKPLSNEPGLEHDLDSPIAIAYNRSIEYHNLHLACVHYVRKTRNYPGLVAFAQIVERYFLNNYEKIVALINHYITLYGAQSEYYVPVYGMETRTDYLALLRLFDATHTELLARWFSSL